MATSTYFGIRFSNSRFRFKKNKTYFKNILNKISKLKKQSEIISIGKNKSTLTNSLIDTTNANSTTATSGKSKNFYRSKTITGVPETNVSQVTSNTAVLFSNVRLQSHRRDDFILPMTRKDTGANRMDLLKGIDSLTTDDEFQNDVDDEQDDEDEDFYEATLKKNYAKSNNNSNSVDLNNTRSSTLTSSSSCSSAFSSMSNLNSNQDKQKNEQHANENNQVTVDLSKYLNNEDDDDDDDEVENEQASYGDAEDESFDEYLTSPAKTNASKTSI